MTEVALSTATTWERPSVPGPGSSLVAVTEARAAHVRRAVESVERAFASCESVAGAWTAVLANRWRPEPASSPELLARQAAWALISMRIIGRSVGALRADAPLRDGEAWFLGEIRAPSLLSDSVIEFSGREAIHALESFTYDDDLRDLLPYVLDAHGPGSRATVMKDPSTQTSRRAKKASGVFYTPSDVAEFIVRETLGELGQSTGYPCLLDPACGSGVFLKAALDTARIQTPSLNCSDFVERCLHGIDINPLAVEAACFVLLHECLRSNPQRRGASPWSLWHRIRCNLCVADALTFSVARPTRDRSGVLSDLRKRLDGAYVPPSTGRLETQTATTLFSEGRPLGSVFPSLSSGADIVIGNPPYARIGPRDDAAALKRRFESLSAGAVAGSDFFPAFIEMMWQFARPGRSASGMVVPLSLACSRRSQLSAVRRAITASSGRWRFAFFDREPHALFGEDVKTRNTIALRRACSGDTSSTTSTIETGPLRRWTSRQRNRLFDTIDFTPIGDNTVSISTGIPKLDGAESSRVFGRLARRTSRLREMCSFGSCLPEDVARGDGGAHVFVAGTAYNFLNVFRPHRNLPAQRAPWSASMVLALRFADEDEAARGFALLCSRVAYWLWRVHEDGFHVTRSFLMGLPFNDRIFDETDRTTLTSLGSHLWDRVQDQQVVSVNGGRQTVAYRPNASEDIRNRIDAFLLEALDIDQSFIEYLRSFTRTMVSVDEKDETRQPRFSLSVTENAMPPVNDAVKGKSRLTKDEWREYTKTVWRVANTSHAEHPAVFPVEIPHRLIKLFSWHGETVLDPFAGTGTTAAAAVPLGRKVLCIDQNRKYVGIIRRDCSHLKNGNLTATELMNVVHGDSRDLSFIHDDSVSLIVSSPPYWNKVDYGSARANLGRVAGYRRFLDKIRPAFEECFRVLQPGRKCCLVTANVNQHTDHGLLTFPLPADFGAILRDIGFVMVTEIIWSKDGTGGRWGSANTQRPIFGSYPYPPNFLFKNVHEYILVFSKPPSRKSKGPKVVPYDELMAENPPQ